MLPCWCWCWCWWCSPLKPYLPTLDTRYLHALEIWRPPHTRKSWESRGALPEGKDQEGKTCSCHWFIFRPGFGIRRPRRKKVWRASQGKASFRASVWVAACGRKRSSGVVSAGGDTNSSMQTVWGPVRGRLFAMIATATASSAVGGTDLGEWASRSLLAGEECGVCVCRVDFVLHFVSQALFGVLEKQSYLI